MVYPRDRAGHGDRRAGGIEIAEILILLSSRLKAGTTVISARARRLFFESSSRSTFLFEHDLRANASRLSRGKTGATFPDHALAARILSTATVNFQEAAATASRASERMRSTMARRPLERCGVRCSRNPNSSNSAMASVARISCGLWPE